MPIRILSRISALVATAGLALPVAAEATYDVEVRPSLEGLPIKVEPLPFDGRLVMRLTNEGSAKVRCDLRYDAAPQPLRRSTVYLEPGETAENSFVAKRKWFEVTVDVACKPADR
jgi:hypothetical protein